MKTINTLNLYLKDKQELSFDDFKKIINNNNELKTKDVIKLKRLYEQTELLRFGYTYEDILLTI